MVTQQEQTIVQVDDRIDHTRPLISPGVGTTGHPGSRLWGQESGPNVAVVLVFNDPTDPVEDYGLGWTLVAFQGGTRCWSHALVGHGANADTNVPQAQARATAVLASHGVICDGWEQGTATPGLTVFLAAINPDADQAPPPPTPVRRVGSRSAFPPTRQTVAPGGGTSPAIPAD